VTDAPAHDTDSIADWAKKSSVSWIRFESDVYPVWHVWADDGICVVGSSDGAIEQPLPAFHDGSRAVVTLRSRADRSLVAEVPVRVEILHPDSDAWDTITGALKAARQNAPDLATEVERWGRDCSVLRLVPDGPITEPADVVTERPRTLPRLS
jgi:hypothetical protein